MPIYERVQLPEQPISEQLSNKDIWNLNHTKVGADFYTLGYAGREIGQVIDILQAANVATLVDIRYSPISPYKRAFNKTNIERSLRGCDIAYVHRPDLGVPRDIRLESVAEGARDFIWAWYDKNVLPQFLNGNLHEFFNAWDHPVALMCVERDPTSCHRHRLFAALEKLGFRGYDL